MEKKINSYGRKVAYCAIGTAISILGIVFSVFFGLTVVPFVFCSMSYFIVYNKVGFLPGLFVPVATALLSFLIFGIIFDNIFNIVIIIPYSIIVFFLREFYYISSKKWHAIIRATVIVVFSVVVTTITLFVVSIFVPLPSFLQNDRLLIKVLIYIFLACVLLVYDFVFINLSKQLLQRLQ